MPYRVEGKCVYIKDTNEKVGCTEGSIKKYLSDLHVNINESESDDYYQQPWRPNNDPKAEIDVLPSNKTVNNICQSEKFCKEQGKITFGQLKAIVENATKKRLSMNIGEGGYKATIRLLPWFLPQLAIGGFIASSARALNKILKPTLTETESYKTWWGKAVLRVFSLTEGELNTTDPLSKVFFISDGLMTMLGEKYQGKFAKYISELANMKPDDEEVPEFFVENELRKWVNDKFLLDPPLKPKTPLTESKEELNESDDFDWAREVEPHPGYNGHPQGIVLVTTHQEIDEFFSMLEKYNETVSDGDTTPTKGESGTYDEFHKALDLRQNFGGENDATISLSFFVERDSGENKLISGFWSRPITYHDVDEWLEYNETYNEEYRFYHSLDEVKNLFSNVITESIITEQAGISFESRKWADIVYGTIMDNPQERTRLIIDGYDYPEAFEDFPIDYVVIDYYNKLTGYGQEHSGYDKDGNYIVLLYVQPGLVDGKTNYDLKSALNHEFKHAWDDYNRLSKGRPSIDDTRESKELYNRDFIQLLSNKQITGPIKDLLKYHYYLSNLERTAYLENVYDGNPTYERMVREIIRKDFSSLKDRFDLDINWHLVNTAYDIPFLKRFKSPIEFIDHSAKDLTLKAQKMLKKINKMKYVHGKL